MDDDSNVNDDGNNVARRIILPAEDDHQILLDCWLPASDGKPVAVIQILHGLGEHAARYERFACACVANGIAVAAHSHRGHGEACPADSLGHFADHDGWNKIISDAWLVRQHLLQRFADAPLTVLGHSMGSYIAQCSVMRNSQGVSKLILSATTLPPRLKIRLARTVARLEILRTGGDSRSELLDKLSFGDFNRKFAPNRSAFDWLSRDEYEVDKYVTDPACGSVSTGQLWHDLLGGLLEISSTRSFRSVPASLPILITGGQLDPVGGQKGLAALATKYRKTGHNSIALRIYEGGRHEMLNETNRAEVTAEIIGWIEWRHN